MNAAEALYYLRFKRRLKTHRARRRHGHKERNEEIKKQRDFFFFFSLLVRRLPELKKRAQELTDVIRIR